MKTGLRNYEMQNKDLRLGTGLTEDTETHTMLHEVTMKHKGYK